MKNALKILLASLVAGMVTGVVAVVLFEYRHALAVPWTRDGQRSPIKQRGPRRCDAMALAER